ncbi:glycosyltransferase family 2 protein [Paenibacillus sp. B2(2019)]|uniref:glycosyltransferase family 2 protein n=1 Tax=Paenibacillus sp. B2(2019) TaxID=2607754 RepID=UPI0039779B2F
MVPKISIIVPVYKVEKYLKRCVDSILAQTYQDFELILVNDGTPDNCGIICDSFAAQDKRIRVIHKENGGLSSARNAGIEVAEGEYIGFVDSDDWITYDMFEYLLNLIEEYDCDVSSVSYILSKGEENIKQSKIEIKCYEGNDSLHNYLFEGMSKRIADFPVWNKLYKRHLFNEIRFPEGQLYEDGATNFMLLKRARKYVKSNKISYFYFQDGASITRRGFQNKDLEILIVGDQMVELALTVGDQEIIKLAKMKQARSYFSLLSKISLYGFTDKRSFKDKTVIELTQKLRSEYIFLLKSPMPLNRKFVMSLLCIHINLVKIPIQLYSKIKLLKL